MPLSDVAIRKAKPADKPLRLFDAGGLYLEVSPSGGKLWRLKYRFDGKEKRLALGIYPDVSLANARERRDDARKLLANEIDPGEHRKMQREARAERATNSFEAVAREWLAKYSPRWAASHAEFLRAHLKCIRRDPAGIPIKLYLVPRNPHLDTTGRGHGAVVIDPRFGFGRPVIDGTGIRTEVVIE